MTQRDDRIRVLHVLPWVTSGGVETRRLSLAQHLPESRFRQRVVCLHANHALPDQIRAAGVPVLSFQEGAGSVFDFETHRRVISEVKTYRPHIIHGAVFEGVTMATIAGLSSDAKLVVEETGDPRIRSWRGDLLMATMARRADAVVGVSPAVTRYLRERLRLPPSRVVLVPNGVEPIEPAPPELAKQFRGDLGIPQGALVIGSVGRIDDSHKRFSVLIDAFSQLSASVPLHLVIVGAGRDLEMLRDLAKTTGVGERVHFTGFVSDKQRAYALMDIFALASIQESFGLVIVEAMFAGLPVVATNVGGIPSIVTPDTGILVEPEAVGGLRDALQSLVDSREDRERFAKCGRERADREYSASRYARDVQRLYENLVVRGRS